MKILPFSMLALLCLVFTATGANGFPTGRPEQPHLSPEEFPIIPWGWTPGDAQALAELKECGFNVAGFVAPQHVELVAKAGLKCFLDDPRISGAIGNGPIEDAEIERRVAEATAKFKDHPAILGYYLRDEPTADLYPNLARWRAALAKADPDALAYINLLPVGAQGPGVKSYEEYVTRFIDTVKPAFVSYDHYTLRDDGSVADTLYLNLEVMRRISMERGIPFWNIILSNSHFHYASPTPGGLRLQAFATLAYGGRGLSYFTYFAPLLGDFREAPVDQFMNKTPTWDMVRNVNLQLHILGPTYLKLKSVNVFHHPTVPAGCSGDFSTSQHLAELKGEGDLLVGEFVHTDGRPFVMVVNKNIRTSAAIELKFKQPGKVLVINPYNGQPEPWNAPYNFLAPGQGMLFTLGK